MSDELDNQEIEDAAESGGPVGGERLSEARREQQISVLEIAKELHLDEGKVRALERNEFHVLGAPVFAKGHLKKYAELVNVDPADVLLDYYNLNRAVDMPPVISVRPKPRQELTPGPWIAVIVVIIIAVTAYWWFSSRPVSTATESTNSDPASAEPAAEPGPADSSAIVPEEVASDAASEILDSTSEEVPAAANEAQAIEAEVLEPETAAAAPDIADGQIRVLVTYAGDCWTEITDASGRRLLFDLGKDGRTVELTGAEPFNVLFGNPGNVSLRVNGADYPLPPTSRPNRPLRLTISGS
jgi:cytoskeleton protein RodZ